jgi:hypothetical protein
MSRRSRRSWGKRALAHETQARIQKVAELYEKGYGPRAIAPAARLPESLVAAMLEMKPPPEGGGGIT